MFRKKILIIIAIILLLLGGWVFLSTKKTGEINPDGSEKNLLSALFPFGTTGNNTQPANTDGQGNSVDGGNNDGIGNSQKLLSQITNIATAGFILLPTDTTPVVQHDVSEDTSTDITKTILPAVRFAERGTGYLYDTDIKGQNLKKVSGTVIARTAQALFADNGNTAILRYVKADNVTISTFLGKYTPSTDTLNPGTLTGSFLPEKISDIVVSADQKNLLYLLPTETGAVGISIKTDGTAKKQLFSSRFSEWLLDWSDGRVMLTTKASSTVPGYMYAVEPSGTLLKTIGGITGLTTKMSPDGKNILYSVSGGDGLSLRIYHIADGTSVSTGLQTLPEKCVWGIDPSHFYCGAGQTISIGPYPDAWYKGVSHFNDAFWKIRANDGTTIQLNNGEGNDIDATNLAFDQSGRYLVFINKNDTSLWSLDLETTQSKPTSSTTKKSSIFVP